MCFAHFAECATHISTKQLRCAASAAVACATCATHTSQNVLRTFLRNNFVVPLPRLWPMATWPDGHFAKAKQLRCAAGAAVADATVCYAHIASAIAANAAFFSKFNK